MWEIRHILDVNVNNTIFWDGMPYYLTSKVLAGGKKKSNYIPLYRAFLSHKHMSFNPSSLPSILS